MIQSRIVHFEQDQGMRDLVTAQVNGLSDAHQVIGGAVDLGEAWNMMHRMQIGDVDANVVLLDSEFGGDESRDAATVVERIHRLDLPVWIIGLSYRPFSDIGVPVKADLEKAGFKAPTLLGVLHRLEEPGN